LRVSALTIAIFFHPDISDPLFDALSTKSMESLPSWPQDYCQGDISCYVVTNVVLQ
jgi:hypothetical protein